MAHAATSPIVADDEVPHTALALQHKYPALHFPLVENLIGPDHTQWPALAIAFLYDSATGAKA
jgi:hypothetical protein